ncbi:MAG: hypothetical protein ACREOP_15185 [Thermodesulfobacteriota bacterium]
MMRLIAAFILAGILLTGVLTNSALAAKKKEVVMMTCVTVFSPDEVSLVQFAQVSSGVPADVIPHPFDDCVQAVADLLTAGFNIESGQVDIFNPSEPSSSFLLTK